MTLKEMWKGCLKLYNESNRLWNEGDKLYRKGLKLQVTSLTEAKELYDEASKLWDEGNSSYDKAHDILRDFINKNYEKKVKIYHENGRIILTNGVIFYYDGNIYEPLEIVMKRIIKEHEEESNE